MNIVAIGINHRTASLEVREKLWFSVDEIRAVLPTLAPSWFSECFLLSTCNRTELYGVYQHSGSRIPTPENVGQMLIDAKRAGEYVCTNHLYALYSIPAVAHLFKVASGVDSMVVGDVQILSQVKEGYTVARESQSVGILLNRMLQAAFRVGKRTRAETEISEGAVSVSYAAVELAGKIFADLSKKSALLIGAGETGELTAKHLAAKGLSKLVIANRTQSKAEQLAASLNGSVVDYAAMTEELETVDVVVASTGTPHYVLTKEQLFRTMKRRSHKPLVILDLGVPRNVEPSANTIENVFLHDLDVLGGMIDRNTEKRRAEIPRVNKIILEELREFLNWYTSLEVTPTIADLHKHFEGIRSSEVEKHAHRFSSVNDKELLELVTKRIVNKLLHVPTTILKNGHDETDEVKRKRIHLVRSLFGLNKDQGED